MHACIMTWLNAMQVDILVNNAGLALGTAGVHENDILVWLYQCTAMY